MALRCLSHCLSFCKHEPYCQLTLAFFLNCCDSGRMYTVYKVIREKKTLFAASQQVKAAFSHLRPNGIKMKRCVLVEVNVVVFCDIPLYFLSSAVVFLSLLLSFVMCCFCFLQVCFVIFLLLLLCEFLLSFYFQMFFCEVLLLCCDLLCCDLLLSFIL